MSNSAVGSEVAVPHGNTCLKERPAGALHELQTMDTSRLMFLGEHAHPRTMPSYSTEHEVQYCATTYT